MYYYFIISTLLLNTIPFSSMCAMQNADEGVRSKCAQKISTPNLTVDQAQKIFQSPLKPFIDENGRNWKVSIPSACLETHEHGSYCAKLTAAGLTFLSWKIKDVKLENEYSIYKKHHATYTPIQDSGTFPIYIKDKETQVLYPTYDKPIDAWGQPVKIILEASL